MRVFVVGTGRCGSSTFYQACKTIKNYTCGHETFAGQVHDFEYPDNHIEVAVQNVQALALLQNKYPDARFVHLVREKEACIKSLLEQCPEYLKAWAFQVFLTHGVTEKVAMAYYHCVNKYLTTVPNLITVRLEDLEWFWLNFVKCINAECDFEEVRKILNKKYNPGINRGRDNYVEN